MIRFQDGSSLTVSYRQRGIRNSPLDTAPFELLANLCLPFQTGPTG